MRQLTGVERTRAVSMAQQETVSLAQMLKVIFFFFFLANVNTVVNFYFKLISRVHSDTYTCKTKQADKGTGNISL